LSETPALSLPSLDNQRRLFEDYLEHLRTLASGAHIAAIKYSSWHHFDTYWRDPLAPPRLVEWVRQAGLPVIHLRRKNRFLQYLSLIRAQNSKQWHSFNGRSATPAMEVSPKLALGGMRRVQQLEESYAAWFDGHDPLVETTYEELFETRHALEATLPRLIRHLGYELGAKPDPQLVKLSPPARGLVTNSKEVLDELRGTPFYEDARIALLDDSP
jgi:hypothetical protein